MTELSSREVGSFSWVDINTPDVKAAKKFYTGLFGWSAQDVPAGDHTYTMFSIGDRMVAGMGEQSPEMKQMKLPAIWNSYIQVDSVDAWTNRAREFGAEVVMEPMDVMDAGRMSFVKGKDQAVVGFWESKKHQGATAWNETGAPCWFELMTRDTAQSEDFYHKVCNWQFSQMEMGEGSYTTFKNGETSLGGLMQIEEHMGQVVPNWMIYFQVENLATSTAKALELGAKQVIPAVELPFGRFTVISDPQGGHLSLWENIETAS